MASLCLRIPRSQGGRQQTGAHRDCRTRVGFIATIHNRRRKQWRWPGTWPRMRPKLDFHRDLWERIFFGLVGLRMP